MRGAASIIVVIVICAAVFALYWFIAHNQLQKHIDTSRDGVQKLEADLAEIARMESEIPSLLAKLPTWQRQYELFRSAIPVRVDDHRFLSAVSTQLAETGSKFIGSEMAAGGMWLDGVSETQFEQLKTAGLDVDTAKKIRVAFYSINITGNYQDVINAFEGLKRYGRLYTIDQVLGPAGGAAGNVIQNVDTKETPIKMTGRIYYGIPENYFNMAAIQRLFVEKGTGMAARNVASSIKSAGRSLLQRQAPPLGNPAAAGEPPADDPPLSSGLTAATGEAG